MRPLYVRAEWDHDASVWVATSDDVPGLATESTAFEALVGKLKRMIPDLLAANGMTLAEQVPFEILARRLELASTQE